jgi:hypothetical protein
LSAIAAPAGLADRDHHVGLYLRDGLGQHRAGFAEHAWQLARLHLESGTLPAIQGAHRFPRWIDGGAVERFEPGQEDGLGVCIHIDTH